MAEYFVDGLNGDDGHAGTSEATAWETLERALSALDNSSPCVVWLRDTWPYERVSEFDVPCSAANPVRLIGYADTPGDGGVVSVLHMAVSSVDGFRAAASNCLIVENVQLISPRRNAFVDAICIRCIADLGERGNIGFNGGSALFCMVIGGVQGFVNVSVTGCMAVATSSYGFGGTANNKGASIAVTCGVGFQRVKSMNGTLIAYGCVSHGLDDPNSETFPLYNVIAYGNGGYGLNSAGAKSELSRIVALGAFGANTSGASSVPLSAVIGNAAENIVHLTADPFVDADNLDFRLNDDPGGGALLKAVGWTLPSLEDMVSYGYGLYHGFGGGGGAPVLALNEVARERLLDGDSFAAVFGAGSLLELYSGANPDDPDDGPDGTRVAYATLPSSPWAAADDGEMAIGTVWTGPIAGGDVVGARLVSSDGNAWAYLTVGDSAMLELPSYTLSSSDTLRITGATIRIPPVG